MKKVQLTAFLFICSIIAFSQKKKPAIEGKALYLGVAYSKPVRAEFDKYMAVISDSLKLTNPLLVKSSYDIHAGISN